MSRPNGFSLVLALESDNTEVKKQVFELLSALCVHNTEGYNRTFECLDSYKVMLLTFLKIYISTRQLNVVCIIALMLMISNR